MFYLIDEKDGLENETILVNIQSLKLMEVLTSKKEPTINLSFRFSEEEDSRFNFHKDACFNVNQVMKNMETVEEVSYKNHLISLTDSENIRSLHKEQFYFHKFSNLLVNIHSIQIAYCSDHNFILITKERNLYVQESPSEIFTIIQNKIKK